MFIEKQREAELARRRGTARRVIVQVIWLIVWGVIAYFLTDYLFQAGYVTADDIYRAGVPREVPEELFFWATLLFIVVVSQIMLTIGFLLGSSRGRRRPGRASAYSDNPDPLDNQFG